MSEDSKIRSLTNELIRRFLRTSEKMPDETRVEIVDEFSQELFNSEYGLIQVRRIVIAGIKGYEKLLKNSKLPGGRKLQRSAAESSKERARRKLTGKTEWFRKKKVENENLSDGGKGVEGLPEGWESQDRLQQGWKEWTKDIKDDGKKESMNAETGWNEDQNIKTRSVLFVEMSEKGILAKLLREVELRLSRITKYRTKIVEGVGSKLKDLLSNTDPWRGMNCGRTGCVPCNQPGDVKLNCRKKNIIYES